MLTLAKWMYNVYSLIGIKFSRNITLYAQYHFEFLISLKITYVISNSNWKFLKFKDLNGAVTTLHEIILEMIVVIIEYNYFIRLQSFFIRTNKLLFQIHAQSLEQARLLTLPR